MALLDGKQGLIFGVANERSYAWHIAKALIEHGANCAFTALPGESSVAHVRKAVQTLGERHPWVQPCNAALDDDLDRVFDQYAKDFPRLDFLIHSIAYADREYLGADKFIETPRQAFADALDISTYSLIAMARRGRAMMAAGGGGSILALTYYGSEKVVFGYNVMAVAKAALECTARYLATDLGGDNIRVNTLSAGPFRTLSSMAINRFRELLEHNLARAPLKRNVSGADVGGAAVWLVSDLASGVTSENLYVDCGVNSIGL